MRSERVHAHGASIARRPLRRRIDPLVPARGAGADPFGAARRWRGTVPPMSWWRSLTVSVLLVGGVAAGLAGCSSEDTPAAPTDPVLLEGQQIFSSQCAGCHGRGGGGGFGSKLSDGQVVENYPDIADQIAVIANGQGSMPGFEGRLTDAQLEAVALYTREVL